MFPSSYMLDFSNISPLILSFYYAASYMGEGILEMNVEYLVLFIQVKISFQTEHGHKTPEMLREL